MHNIILNRKGGFINNRQLLRDRMKLRLGIKTIFLSFNDIN